MTDTRKPYLRAPAKGGPKADPWFRDWWELKGIPKSTAMHKWQWYRIDTDQPIIPPGKVSEQEGIKFIEWLKADEARTEEDRDKEDQRRQAEYKLRYEIRQRCRQVARVKAALDNLIKHEGEVYTLQFLCHMLPELKEQMSPETREMLRRARPRLWPSDLRIRRASPGFH